MGLERHPTSMYNMSIAMDQVRNKIIDIAAMIGHLPVVQMLEK